MAKEGGEQAEGWWMDGGWQWWLQSRQQITKTIKGGENKGKIFKKGDLQGQKGLSNEPTIKEIG